MSKTHHKRLFLVISFILGISLTLFFILYALKQNINLFYTPSQLMETPPLATKTIRVGGMVVKGSVKRQPNLHTEFTVSDLKHTIAITYTGILPDLFREGQGIVAEGKLSANGVFQAEEVLAKHDENYMPPEIADMHLEQA